MSFPFGWMGLGGKKRRRPFAKAKESAIDPSGRRLLCLTRETNQPVWAPPGHSMTLAANGAGKTTCALMPWLMSLLASKDRPCILILDSKNGEVASMCAPMLRELGVPVAIIDEGGVLPANMQGRTQLNPMQSVVETYLTDPLDLAFATDAVTHTAIEEPDQDARNRYWRAWPRLLIEFAILVLLKRNPDLATPGGVWMLISNPEQLVRFAEIEAVEGDGMLKTLAIQVKGMAGHEHMPQHIEAATSALRVFAIGTRLHKTGHKAKQTHAELIKKRSVVFLCGDQANISSLGIFYGLHLMSFIRAGFQGAGPMWIGADEATNAPIRKIVDATTTLRAFGISISYIGQSRSEFKRKFGEDALRTIEDNSITKTWMGFSSFEEAERVSKAIGEEHAVATSIGGTGDDLRRNTNLSLIKQPCMTAAELMAMRRDELLWHMKGFGFGRGRLLSQANIAPYCDLIADNPLEGGRLPSDPKITFALPEEARS